MSSFGQKFGELIRERRGVEGLTQQELAANAGVRKALISDLENGKSANPHQSTVDALAVALNISREDIAECRKGADASPTPAKQTDTPAISNLPDLKTRHFHGRDQYLAELRAALAVGDASITQTQTIQGLGGVGKTTLAIHYARLPEVAARFPIRWWVSAETREGMEKGLGDLGRRVGVVPDKTPDAEAAKLTLGWLREAPRGALVLFDNVEDGPLLAEFLPGDATAALVTTRVRGMGGLAQVSLDCWQPETARDFLLERTGSDDAAAALALAEALGGLPLACEQAGAYCAEAGETLAGYLARFQASPAKMMSRKAQGSAQEDTVAKTFALAIDRAAADCAGARAMLSVMAELASEPMPLAVFGHENAPEGLRDAEDASDAADALVRWALVERIAVRDALRNADTPCISAHRLVRLAASALEAEATEGAARALGGAFPFDIQYGVGDWPLVAVLAPHSMQLVERIAAENLEPTAVENFSRPLNQAALFFQIVRSDYANAFRMFGAALDLNEAAYGSHHPQVAKALINLASVLRALGGTDNLLNARFALERALKINQAKFGPDHQKVSVVLSHLAEVIIDLGEARSLTTALAILQRALKIDEAEFGERNPHIAVRLSSIASVLHMISGSDNLVAALNAVERALKIDKAEFRKWHPRIAIRLSILGRVLCDIGGKKNLAAAREAHERALEIVEQNFGSENSLVAEHLSNFATVLLQIGGAENLNIAQAAQERALKIDMLTYGAEHGKVGFDYGLLARLHNAIGSIENVKRAREFSERAVLIHEKAYGADHRHTRVSIHIRDVEVGG